MKIFKLKPLTIATCFAGLLFSCISTAYTKDTASEDLIKAAFVYRFTQYTKWPEPIGDKFNLCVYGDGKVVEHIKTFAGKTVHGATLEVTSHDEKNIVKDHHCNAAYIDTQSRNEFRAIKASLNELTLIISDMPGAFEERTDIALITEPNRITFSINVTQARDRNLSFSGQMLKLAQRIL